MTAESLDNTQRLLGRLDELESELSRVHHALEHHERLATLGTIAGLIAHEFNNILTPVLSYAQMALGAPEDRDLATKALQKAADGAERASQIAGSILGFVRDDGPDVWAKARAAPRPQPEAPQHAADLRSAAQDAIACMGRDLGRDLIELNVTGEAGVRAAIKPLALQHILLNVILNARAAMLPLGGALTIETGFADEPPRAGPEAVSTAHGSTGNTTNGGWAVIRIRDTGRGMRPETLGRIFEPFFTKPADQATGRDEPTERRRGTGLGMTMCKRLADEVGGYLTVESRIGQGTCVTIVLPAASPARQLRRSA